MEAIKDEGKVRSLRNLFWQEINTITFVCVIHSYELCEISQGDRGGYVLFFDSYLVTASKTCAYTSLKRKHQRKVS